MNKRLNNIPINQTKSILNYRLLSIAISILILLPGCKAHSQGTCDWPSFHGPDRTNKSEETGLMKKWPAGGPILLFTISGLGEGYSSVSFGDGLIFTAGKYRDQTYVFAFDLNGKPVWKSPNGKAWSTTMPWASSYTGPRATPTYDNGRIYHLSEGGRLASYDAKTGREMWAKDLPKEFDAPPTEYGYAESVFIDGDNLYVRPAGKKGFQVCLDKNDGKLIWANTDIPGVEGYSSAVVFDYGDNKHITGSSSNCYYGVDAATGRLLWKVDFENQRGLNLTDAIAKDGYVFITSGYGKGSMLFRLKASGNKFVPETVWQSGLMDNHHGGVILHNDYLYGSGSNSRGWFCLEFFTGKQIWNNTRGKGAITYADGMLYLLDERSGSMKLVKATPDSYESAGEFNVPSGGQSMYWAHPVVCGRRLYVRHWDKVFVYDIGQ
jgi:outer membrane protein assembly factor BamB